MTELVPLRADALPTPERYPDAGLPLATEVYGFLDALDVTWSTFEVDALTAFIQGRIDKALDALIVPSVTRHDEKEKEKDDDAR